MKDRLTQNAERLKQLKKSLRWTFVVALVTSVGVEGVNPTRATLTYLGLLLGALGALTILLPAAAKTKLLAVRIPLKLVLPILSISFSLAICEWALRFYFTRDFPP